MVQEKGIKCSACGQTKSESEFQKNRSRRNGRQSHCRECFKKKYQKYDPEQNRRRHILRYYGLTWEDYVRAYSTQEGKCSICGIHLKLIGDRDIKSGAHVDHDHVTGKIRGLICHDCNAGLGYFQDSEEILGGAIRYLQEHKG